MEDKEIIESDQLILQCVSWEELKTMVVYGDAYMFDLSNAEIMRRKIKEIMEE